MVQTSLGLGCWSCGWEAWVDVPDDQVVTVLEDLADEHDATACRHKMKSSD